MLCCLLQGNEVYNHTTTDIASDVRRERLNEVYSIISDVNTALGLNVAVESKLEMLENIPLPLWILVVSLFVLVVCFYVARILHGDVGVLARSRLALRRKHSSAVV